MPAKAAPDLRRHILEFFVVAMTSLAGTIPEATAESSAPPPRFRLRGRLDTDALWATQDATNLATFGNLPDVVGFRRARIGAECHLPYDRRSIAELDMASGNVVPRDVYWGDGDLESEGEWRLGHQREPFSLEGGTSANSFAFMERSAINALDPGRNWGIGSIRADDGLDSTLQAGTFISGSGPSDLQGGDGNDAA